MKPHEQKFAQLTGVVVPATTKPEKVLVLLHGVGSNERNLLDVGSVMAPDRTIISLRAPIEIGPSAYAWFQVQFKPTGPVHNWDQAQSSLHLLEDALKEISAQTKVPMNKISVYGFSQGAIMTIGLALRSELSLESYIAGSGRTLPEFAEGSVRHPVKNIKERQVFVAHGTYDDKLPLAHGQNTEKVLKAAGVRLQYREYPVGHTIPEVIVLDAKKWLESR